MRQRPSSEPLVSARSGGGRGGGGNLSASLPPDQQTASRTTRALSSAGVRGAVSAEGSIRSSSSKKETDERIRRLENEVRLLQRDKEVWQQTRTAVAPGTAIRNNNSRGGASSSSGAGGGRTTSRSWPGSSRHRNGREVSSGGTAAAASAGGGGAMVLRSRSGDHGSQQAERLVLRSANGTPRVRLTPSERRSAREYTDDVTSVRDLQ